jgi:hypothetical protein
MLPKRPRLANTSILCGAPGISTASIRIADPIPAIMGTRSHGANGRTPLEAGIESSVWFMAVWLDVDVCAGGERRMGGGLRDFQEESVKIP